MSQAIKPSVTSVDVARHANVSQSAVSRTFTPGASVSAKTKAKVLKAASELGYRPNALARAMISGRSRIVAVLVADMDNQFYPGVLDRLTRALQARGFQAMLFMTDSDRQDPAVQQMLDYRVEAIFIASAKVPAALIRGCAEHGIPTIMLNRYSPMSMASRVVSDNVAGGQAVAELFVRGGHERIAFVAGADASSTSRERESGLRKGLAAFNQRLWKKVIGGYSFEGAERAACELFSGEERPDAIFVANDHMAFAVMDVARSQFGLRIPDDVSIVGYDDVPEASWKSYDLTTVHQCPDAMVQAATQILVEQLGRKAVRRQTRILDARLVLRSSARLPEDLTRAEIATPAADETAEAEYVVDPAFLGGKCEAA